MARQDGRALTSFQWLDPLNLNALLTDDENMVSETAETFAQEKLRPRVISAPRNERFDRQIMTELGELGLLGSTIRGWPETCMAGTGSSMNSMSSAT